MKSFKLLLSLFLILAVIISIIYFYVKTETKQREGTYSVLSVEQQKELEEFAKILEQNNNLISFIKDSVNSMYKYSYDIVGVRKPTNDFYDNISYYGKTNIRKAFIFSLHKPQEISQIDMYDIGLGKYLGIDMDGNLYEITIIE
ncbi:MAG: hypothetical protein ACK5LL_16200 [Suipraeoptans sp.]